MGIWQALTAAVENVVFSYEEGMPDGFHLLHFVLAGTVKVDATNSGSNPCSGNIENIL
jgi:hypothetical protein